MRERSEEVVVGKVSKEGPGEALIKKIAAEVSPIVKTAISLVIRTDKDYERAGGFLKTIKGFLDEIDKGEIGKIDRSTKLARADAIALRKKAEGPLLQAEGLLKPKIAMYLRRKQEEAQVEAARVRREAIEKVRKEEEERREAERLESIAALVEEGKVEEAAGLLEEVLDEVRVEEVKVDEKVVKAEIKEQVKEVVKVAGVSVSKKYRANVFNLDMVIAAVAGGKASKSAIQANLVWLNSEAREKKSTELLGIPGVEVIEEDVVSSGR